MFLAAKLDLAKMLRQEIPVGDPGSALHAGGAEHVRGELHEYFAGKVLWRT